MYVGAAAEDTSEDILLESLPVNLKGMIYYVVMCNMCMYTLLLHTSCCVGTASEDASNVGSLPVNLEGRI